MLVIGASATLQAHGFVDAVFFTFVGVSRVCSSHSRLGFFSSAMVGVRLVRWSGSPLVVSVWMASFLWFSMWRRRGWALPCGVVSVFARFSSN